MLFDPKNFDPSKLDPRIVSELTALMRQLPPEKIMKMQSLMHNSMAGFDISKEVAEFENSLPFEFRQKLFQLMSDGIKTGAVPTPQAAYTSSPAEAASTTAEASSKMTIKEARLTILRGVSEGTLTPEEALQALFNE